MASGSWDSRISFLRVSDEGAISKKRKGERTALDLRGKAGLPGMVGSHCINV